MNAQRSDKERIFAAAAELDPVRRSAFLDAACGSDAPLRAEIESLLRHDAKADGFLERPAASAPSTDLYRPITEGPGTTIGPYKLLQQIGEGGFGVVYMAEQQRPVRRKVALKIIKPGMDTREVVARFESERQALALMDHPNIARVLDAGATETGRPYFVMELVKGVPITEYCDKNQLPTEKRLALFITVCHAVQHAHQKGIIHRDLKPSNVMVTLHDGQPVPKVIDFGVSKAMSQQLTEKTLFTAYGQMIGTPAYMSPEQAEMSGLDIDTRSDTYSLGVLLYELLTGTTPFDGRRLREAGYAEMLRIIREEAPPRPSTRVSTMGDALTVISSHRSTDPKKLGQQLRGDLDVIVMKALEKERSRRYDSPNAFAEDIQRYLQHEAIVARPASAAYRLKKFAARNKLLVTAATAIAAALLLGLGASTVLAIHAYDQWWQAQKSLAALKVEQVRTEQERQKAVSEAARARQAEAHAAEQEQLAKRRAKEAEQAQAAEAELRLAADEKRRAIEQQKNQIEGLNVQLQGSMENQRRAIYAAEMNLVRLEAQRGNLPRLRELLMQQIPGANQADLRGWEWTYWYRFLHRAEVVRRFEGFAYGRPDSALAVAPGGRLVALTRGDKTEWIELASGKVLGSVPVRQRLGPNRTPLSETGRLIEDRAISQAAYWPQGYTLVNPSSIAVWEPGGEKRSLAIPENNLQLLSFTRLSADGTRAAAVGNDVSHRRDKPASRLLVWNVETGELILNQVQPRELNRLELSHDGALLVAWLCHSTLRLSDQPRDVATLLDVATGQSRGVARHNDDVDHAYLLPEGNEVLLSTLGYSGANRKELLLWDVAQPAPRKLTPETMPDYVKGAVSPDGRLFAVSGHTVSKIRLFDTRSGQLVSTLHNEATTIDSLTFSADSRHLIASSTTGEVLRWDLEQDSDLFRLRAQPLSQLAYAGYAVSPDQSLLAYMNVQGSLRLRTLDGTEQVLSAGDPQSERPAAHLQFSPDGKYLAAGTNIVPTTHRARGSRPVAVDLYDVASGKSVLRWTATRVWASRLLFTPDSSHLLVLQPPSSVIQALPCTATPGEGKAFSSGTVFQDLWTDRSGRVLGVNHATRGRGSAAVTEVRVRDALADQPLAQFQFPGATTSLDIVGSPSGQHVAVRNFRANLVQIWSLANPEPILESPGSVVVFSPDGNRVAIGEASELGVAGIGVGAGTTIRRTRQATIWDVAAARQIASLSLAGNPADELRFSPDGRRLLTLHGKQALGSGGAIPEGRLWDVASGREIMAIPVAEVNHYIWDLFYDRGGDRLTLLVFAKSMGTSGGWGSTVYDARPLSEEEDAQLVARRRVMELLAQNPLPDDAVAALEADTSLTPLAKRAALALARQQPVVPETLATFCFEVIAQPDFRPNGRQAAVHCAEALMRLEPDALRSPMLLGGALFRAGRLAEAREVLQKFTGDKTRTIDERDQVVLGCGLLVLAQIEHQFGNAAVVTELLERYAVVASRGPLGSTSTAERTLFTELYYETSSIVGSYGSRAASTPRFMPSEALLKSIFERYDANKDGQLTKSEIPFTSLWAELIARDQNNDGQLSLPEFVAAMQAIQVSPTPASTAPSKPPRREYDEQLALLQDVLKRNPDDPASLAARARLLAANPDKSLRDGKQALADATRACVLTNWKNPLHLDALAMAYAETGDFNAAVKWQQQALADLPKGLAPEFAARLTLYQQRQKYRLPGRYEEVPGWGRLADRAGDCQVEASGAALRINVPGSLHDLSGASGNYDAPRVVREVTGDFTAQVKVAFPLTPREYLADSNVAYQGAGLIVAAGLEHCLRVERAAWLQRSTSALSRMVPYVEYWNGGNRIGYTSRRLEEAQTTPPATWLRLTRRGRAFEVASSPDGANWTVLEPSEATDTAIPASVRVGVVAINNSSQPLAVEFAEWKLTQP